MTASTHDHHKDAAAMPAERESEVSRRAMLAGAVATTAVVTVVPIANLAYAAQADPDMIAFLLLSAALTGVRIENLAPEFVLKNDDILNSDAGVDPINVKNEYFTQARTSDAATFGKLLQIAKDHPRSAADILAAVNTTEDTKFLARSIVLLWYLGSWYKPKDLMMNVTPPATPGATPAGTRAFISSQVISPKAYTQGLVWKLAQAHPMGYSNLQFGYWSRNPNDPNDPGDRSNIGFITPTIP
jgi:hypothetical protein